MVIYLSSNDLIFIPFCSNFIGLQLTPAAGIYNTYGALPPHYSVGVAPTTATTDSLYTPPYTPTIKMEYPTCPSVMSSCGGLQQLPSSSSSYTYPTISSTGIKMSEARRYSEVSFYSVFVKEKKCIYSTCN